MNISFLQIRKQREAVTSSRSHSWTPADSGFQRQVFHGIPLHGLVKHKALGVSLGGVFGWN